MQRIVALSLCLVLLSGCGSFNFSMFGISMDDFGDELSTEEKAGTVLLIAIVVAVGVTGAAVAGG